MKKWSPRNRPGRDVAVISSVMESEEVLLAKTARGRQIRSRAANASRLAPRFSTIASMTRSQSARSWIRVVPFLLDAIRAVEEGVGSITDIDQGMKLGCGHPMGPLTLNDLVGIDTTYFIANIMFEEFRETRFAPPPLLKRMVMAGHLGKKSGKGFYDHAPRPS